MSSERTGEETSLSKDLRINEMIRVPNVRVVDEDGSQLGVMPTYQALQTAQERGYDLVEVAPTAAPPVEFKEIRLKPKIGKGDFDTKVRRAIQFLEDGDRVKVTVQFRGREVSHAYIGRDLLTRFGDDIKDHGTVDRQPLLEGKSMSMTVASTHKPKIVQTPTRDEAAPEGPTPPPTIQEPPPAMPAAGG
jgi:translation initiation factor IF-3